MQSRRNSDCRIEAGVRGTVIGKPLAALVIQRPAMVKHARHVAVHKGLEDEKHPVDSPSFASWIRSLVDQLQ